jgi:peptidoglycan/xylan/chitin deacetylase (PgdA/CDA1 family)
MKFLFCFLLVISSQVFALNNNTLNQKEIAVTFDDLPFAGPDEVVDDIKNETKKLLTGLQNYKIPAIGFVNEKILYKFGEVDARIMILRMWLQAGFELGNHTFSHPSLQITPLQEYEEDVIRGDTVTKMLLQEMDLKPRYFRHPFLTTGSTEAVKKAFEEFLITHGYKVAPITIKSSDWLFNLVYVDAKRKKNANKMAEIAKEYLEFTNKIIEYYENISNKVLNYQVKQIMLLHANELNSDYIDELAKLIKNRGYHFINIDDALKDRAYQLPDTHIGPIGYSWLYHWAYTKGIPINVKAEPQPPVSIQTEFNELMKHINDTSRYGT